MQREARPERILHASVGEAFASMGEQVGIRLGRLSLRLGRLLVGEAFASMGEQAGRQGPTNTGPCARASSAHVQEHPAHVQEHNG